MRGVVCITSHLIDFVVLLLRYVIKYIKRPRSSSSGPSIFYWCLLHVAVFAGAAVLNPATAGVVPSGRNGLDIVFVTLIAPVTPINMKYLSHNHKQAQWTV
jgi:hypothetical protein